MTLEKCIQSVWELRNTAIFCRVFLFSMLLWVSTDYLKAQSPGVTIENIGFESAGVTLAGTIYTPVHPQAAVVLVHGSGQATRMEDLAMRFAHEGISVLTYDKRGVGESGGIYAGPEVGTNNVDPANLNLLAEDASAAINILYKRHNDIPVGLVGISQAGWVIPLAANKNPVVNFMLLFSGAVIPTLDQLIFQHLTDGNSAFWDSHTEAYVRDYIHEAREHIRNNPDDYKLGQFVSTDPRDALDTLSIPGIWLFGGKDIQIPIGISIEYLNTFKAHGKPYEYCLFPTLGHNIIYTDTNEPVDIAVYWIKARRQSR